ncbi:MAG: CxxC-x17-CxxC domain-containing protein [Candidatus Paceibacterota bacterium]
MKDFKKSYGSTARSHSGDRSAETHKTNCSECHAPCEVPFKPNGKKPVYCRNCFKHNMPTTAFSGQPFSRPTEYKEDGSTNDLKKQFSILNTKLDRLISAIEAQTRALSDGQ